MNNKILLVFILGIILLGSVSAFEFDNVIRYEKDDMKVNFENAFGLPLIGSHIGSAELKSHPTIDYIKSVRAGDSVVIWYEMDFKEIYEDGLEDVEFTNLETGETIEREWEYVYMGDVEYTEKGKKCEAENSSCVEIKDKVKIKKGWVEYNLRDIPKGKITIGVRTKVISGELTDVVLTIAGEKIKKHAGFSGAGAGTLADPF